MHFESHRAQILPLVVISMCQRIKSLRTFLMVKTKSRGQKVVTAFFPGNRKYLTKAVHTKHNKLLYKVLFASTGVEFVCTEGNFSCPEGVAPHRLQCFWDVKLINLYKSLECAPFYIHFEPWVGGGQSAIRSLFPETAWRWRKLAPGWYSSKSNQLDPPL